jgi:pimeloyl-ACP methyl ester carboxylesterase
MTAQTAGTAETKHVRVSGNDLAYRELGEGGAAPLLLLQRFRATVDHWDPEFLDALASGGRVIVFDNAGVGGSAGEVPESISDMADTVAAFAQALGLTSIDLGGWSMGGMVAQAVAVRHPDLVRRLVLIGTCPPGNPDFVPPEEAWRDVAVKPTYDLDDIVALFYTESRKSRAAAAASEQRIAARPDRQPEIPFEQVMHQANAIFAYYEDKEGLFPRLAEIRVPVLVGAADHDRAFPLKNQATFAAVLPDVRVAVYPDSGHGFQHQYVHEFADLVNEFRSS